ncbi:MAG: hypothetical protein O7A98_06200 [Acidobacteria bacterium]|nr:hypothetical protein [Acidobacteriota bacterium]
MKRKVLVLAIAALSLPVMGAMRPAEAASRWFAGAAFSIGGAHFSLGFSDHHHGYRHAPRYFYRTSYRLHYDGYQCGSACYIRDRHYYHASSCPLIRHHFRRYGFEPAGGYGYYGYQGTPSLQHYRYDRNRYDSRHHLRHDRYDRRHHRYDRRHHRYDRRDDRHDRRGRSRGRGHDHD